MSEIRGSGSPSSRKLFRALGIVFGIAVTLGGTFGVGILRTPGQVAASTQNAWWMMGLWLAGGVYILASALTLSEVAAMLPRTGGFYVYAREAFGEAVGFSAGWADWLTQSASIAYLSLAVGDFAVVLWSPLRGWAPVVGSSLIVLLTSFQIRGLRASSRTQEITSAVQATGFLLLIAACLLWSGSAQTIQPFQAQSSQAPFGSAGHHSLAVMVIALRAIAGTYDGWYSAIYFAEEDKNPGRNLPRSMIFGVLTIITMYLLLNFAYLHVLGYGAMTRSNFPASDAARVLGGAVGERMITVLSLLSLPAVISASLLCATRILFAMSRDRLFWTNASEINRRGTPRNALLISAGSAILLLFFGTFDALLGITGIFTVMSYALAFVSLVVLRRKRPDAVRPFRVPAYPWLPSFVIVASAVFLMLALIEGKRDTLAAFGLVACSFPMYLLCKSAVLQRSTNSSR